MKMKTKIEALQRLIDKRFIWDELINLCIEEKIVTKEHVDETVQYTKDQAEFLYEALESGIKSEKIQMVRYDWQLLPQEYIKLLIIFEKTQIEFMYGSN